MNLLWTITIIVTITVKCNGREREKKIITHEWMTECDSDMRENKEDTRNLFTQHE